MVKKSLVLSVLAALSFCAPVLSQSYLRQDHQSLYNAVEQAGVTISINPSDCEGGIAGYYHSVMSLLVICQQHQTGKYGVEVAWSADDLDTLRHEAHHMLQDCLEGVRADGLLSTMFTGDELTEFIELSSLSAEQVKAIVDNYSSNGASREVIIKEIEAFAVARDVSADRIASGINRMCEL